MSEHYFGLGRGDVGPGVYQQAAAIAAKHGAHLVHVDLPGEGPRYWFAARNYGAPFDGATERAVLDDLEAGGLARDGVPCLAEMTAGEGPIPCPTCDGTGWLDPEDDQ